MALETLIGEPEEGKYWNPTQIGEKIEGNLRELEEDDWGRERMILEMPDETEKVLPSHADLIRYNNKVEIGDYLVITLSKIIKSTNPDYNDKMVYTVQKDPEKAVEYEEYEGEL